MKQYLDLLDHVLNSGNLKEDRTGTGTHSVFGWQMRFDLKDGLPLLTTKKLHLRSIIHELLWFIKGDTNISYLKENKVSIWDEWADSNGDLGPVYGKQWRSWDTPDGRKIDQLNDVINQIKKNPNSRRLIVSAWNPSDVVSMALPPCHCLFQFYVSENKLSCQLYQRSADIFLGVPFNIASYSLLTHLIAKHCGLIATDFYYHLGNCHIYDDHEKQLTEQMQRTPFAFPTINIKNIKEKLEDYSLDDIEISNYSSYENIKMEMRK